MIQNNDSCPRCTKNKLVTDSTTGEIFCGSCGFVISDQISDNGSERTFSDSTVNRSRTGDKISLVRHDKGLSTIINPSNKDASGKPLSASMKASLTQIRKWDSRSQSKDSTERNLKQAMGELLKIKEKLSLPDSITERAAYIYRKALEKKLTRGRSISGMAAAVLYAACRETGIPRSLNEVSDASNLKRGTLAINYRALLKELELSMPVPNSVSCIAKIASAAILSEKTKRNAASILKKAEDQGIIAGKDPMGMAAAALYLSCLKTGQNVTQSVIAKAAGMTEVTVRNRCKSLKPILEN